jgi:hypothetical protein
MEAESLPLYSRINPQCRPSQCVPHSAGFPGDLRNRGPKERDDRLGVGPEPSGISAPIP